jgi:hypothetical protein
VHQLWGPYDGATERLADGLVAQAHAEHGDALDGGGGNQVAADAGVFRAPRSGRDEDSVGFEGQRARVQAGAGIVADSNPAEEYDETRDKARALLRALELAERGL